MTRAENGFERRVREGEEALERRDLRADGKRPLVERWWWYLCVSAGAWSGLVSALLDGADRDPVDLAVFGIGSVALTVLFLVGRRRGSRRRAALRARLAQEQPGGP